MADQELDIDELKRLALIKYAKDKLAKADGQNMSTGAPAQINVPPTPAGQLGNLLQQLHDRFSGSVSDALDYLQKNATYGAKQIAGGALTDMDLPGVMGGAQTGPSPASALAARAYQGITPYVQNNELENSDAMQQATRQLVNRVGDLPAAALSVAAQQGPMMAALGGYNALRGAGNAEGNAGALAQLIRGIRDNAAVNAMQSAAGAPRGQRLGATVEGATNPMNALLAIPGMMSALHARPGAPALMPEAATEPLPPEPPTLSWEPPTMQGQAPTVAGNSPLLYGEPPTKTPTGDFSIMNPAVQGAMQTAATADQAFREMGKEPPTVSSTPPFGTALPEEPSTTPDIDLSDIQRFGKKMTTEDVQRMQYGLPTAQSPKNAAQKAGPFDDTFKKPVGANENQSTKNLRAPLTQSGAPVQPGEDPLKALPNVLKSDRAGALPPPVERFFGAGTPPGGAIPPPVERFFGPGNVPAEPPTVPNRQSPMLMIGDNLQPTKVGAPPMGANATFEPRTQGASPLPPVLGAELPKNPLGGESLTQLAQRLGVAEEPQPKKLQAAKQVQQAAQVQTFTDPKTKPVPNPYIPAPGDSAQGAVTPNMMSADTSNKMVFRDRAPSMLGEVVNQAVPAKWRADSDGEQAAVRQWNAGKYLADVRARALYPQFREMMSDVSPAQQRQIKAYVEQQLGADGSRPEGRNLPMPQALKDAGLFRDMLNANAQNRDYVMQQGGFTPEQMERMEQADQLGNIWLHRQYLANMDPKFFRKSQAAMTGEVAQQLVADKAKQGKPISMDEALMHLRDLVVLKNPNQRGNYARASLNKALLTDRGQVPSYIQDYLGVLKDPAYVFANSAAESERLAHHFKVAETFTSPQYKGQVWDDRAGNPAMYSQPIPPNPQAFGAFAGKYVAPQLYETLMQAPAHALTTVPEEIAGAVNRAAKMARVSMGPLNYLKHIFGNWSQTATAGLPVWHANFVPRMLQGLGSMLKYGNGGFDLNASEAPDVGKLLGDRKWAQMAVEDGVAVPGIGYDAAGQSQRALAKQLYYAAENGGRGGLLHAGLDVMQRGMDKLGQLHDLIDNSYRTAAYIEHVTKFRAAGDSMADARMKAAQIVDSNFISSNNAGPGVKAAYNKLGGIGGVLNPYLKRQADVLRWSLGLIKDSTVTPVMSFGQAPGASIPKPASGTGISRAFNLATQYGLMAGAFAALRAHHGISDAEVAAAKAAQTDAWQGQNPLATALPWRDAQGRVQFLDLSNAGMEPAHFLKGSPSNSVMQNVMQNIALLPVNMSLAEPTMRRILQDNGIDTPDYARRASYPGQPPRWIEDVWNTMRPDMVRNLQEGLRKSGAANAAYQATQSQALLKAMGGALRPGETQLTPGQALMQMTPFPIQPADKVTANAARNEANQKMHQLQTLQKAAGRDQGLKMDQAQRDNVMRAIKEKQGQEKARATRKAVDLKNGGL